MPPIVLGLGAVVGGRPTVARTLLQPGVDLWERRHCKNGRYVF